MSRKYITAIFFAFFFFTVFLSCNGQQKSSSEKTQADNSIPRSNDPFLPLFYEGQLCHWARCVLQDRRGDLWIGTNHYGVIRYSGDSIQYLGQDIGPIGFAITEILEDRSGNLWFATNAGLSKYDGENFHHYTKENGLLDDEIWSMAIAQDGTIWLGTLEGACRFDGAEFESFPLPDIAVQDTTSMLSYKRISSIIEDSRGNIWFGRDGFGICIYHPSKMDEPFTHFTKANGLPDNNVADLLLDRKGNVWIGTMYGGLSAYNGHSFRNFTQDSVITGEETYGLYEDKSGSIWIAAEHHGVYRYNPMQDSFSQYGTADGLDTHGVISMYEDNEGRFWLAAWKGLFRYDGETFFPVTKTGPWH